MSLTFPTGNQFLSIPTIRSCDAAIETLSVVLDSLGGLLEMEGSAERPLLSYQEGSAAAASAGAGDLAAAWSLGGDWIPRFAPTAAALDSADKRGTVCAPPDQRFFLYRMPTARRGGSFVFHLERLYQTINVRHELTGWTCRAQNFSWSYTPGIVLDLHAGPLLVTLSLRGPEGSSYALLDGERRLPLEMGGAAIERRGGVTIEVCTTGEPLLVVGIGPSRVAARSADLEVDRLGADRWLRATDDWLAARALRLDTDPRMQTAANRNGHFARFFAMATTLDTGRTVSMTSRSHRYYVSAAYWDRDSLLWLYPFLVRNDPDHALQLLRYAYGTQLANAGIHSRDIRGQILEYGFELDELCAPLIALGEWLALCPERPLLEEEMFRRGAAELLGRLRRWRCADVALYRTELMPTDDLLVGGRDLLTYNNALVLHALRLLLPWADRIAPHAREWMASDVEAISPAIHEHLVADGVYQWSTALGGEAEFYDEAAGSLLLLPYFGLCAASSPVYRKTVATLYSGAYPYRMGGRFDELGNRHTAGAPHPWVLSACNSALSGVRTAEGLALLRDAQMDGGIACESINNMTGAPESGEHFATCAGFVAHAIATATGSYSEQVRARDPHRAPGAAGEGGGELSGERNVMMAARPGNAC
jgi:hypothetical protein